MTLIEELKKRKVLNNITNEDNLNKAVKSKGYFYLGIDPTGSSLHLGHYQNLNLLRLLMKHGLNPVVLVGGATGVIGDPSGRSSERNLLDEKTLNNNVTALTKQIKAFVDKEVEVLNNYDWFKTINTLDFLKNVGKQININYMLSKESVKERIETGLSYTEFSYMLLQAYDFAYLYKTKKIYGQLGGSDQWGNITAGLELIRKENGTDHNGFGITTELITDKNGKKFGKSEGNPIWLDLTRTSSYEIYQFFLNQNDEMAENLLWKLSSLDIKDIEKIIKEHNEAKHLRVAQKELAKNVITDLHGKKELDNAIEISEAIFKNKINELSKDNFLILIKNIDTFKIKNGTTILEAMELSGFTSSRRETRDFLKNNAFRINGELVSDENIKLTKELSMHDKYLLIQLGKKKTYILEM